MTDTSKQGLIEEAAKAIGEVTYTTSNDQVRAARAALAVFEQAHSKDLRVAESAEDERIERALDYIENGTMPPERREWLRALALRRTAVQEPTSEGYREAYETWKAEGQRQHAALLEIWHMTEPGDTSHLTFGDNPQRVVDAVRSAQEPQGEPTPINGKWVCGKCAREVTLGRDDGQIPRHHRTCPKGAQAEPTDAQVMAALNAWYMEEPQSELSAYSERAVQDMRAALRAAAAIGQEEKR